MADFWTSVYNFVILIIYTWIPFYLMCILYIDKSKHSINISKSNLNDAKKEVIKFLKDVENKDENNNINHK